MNIKKNYLIYGAIALVVVLILLMREAGPTPKSPETSSQTNTSPASQSQTPQAPSAPKKSVTPKTSTPSLPQAAVITYTTEGYTPSVLTIKAGTKVTFKNTTPWGMWPASAMHPTHRVYPTSGGCVGSTFDSCIDIQPGGSWSFTFDYKGTWKYHDHIRPTLFGTVVVQ